jgi:MscS family membrane protein
MRIAAKPMAPFSRPSGLDWFLFLFLALSAPLAVAQDAGTAFDPYPLRPADTSSPRDTLRSFNESITNAGRAFYADEPEAEIARALRPALESFDFSQLPERGRDGKEFETILLLKSILDRIDLPPEEDIPGDEAVADEENPLTRWAIPNTRITITKVEEGPRAGEFLFTAETVDGLEQFYELAKHLPYKRGLVGLYEGYLHRPGRMVPRSWVAALPAWSTTDVLGKALWKWLGFVVVAVAAFFLVHRLLRWGRRWDERHESTGVLLRFGLPFSVVASIAIVYACRYVLLSVFRLVGEFGTVLSFLLWTLIFAGVGWFISLTASRIADVINAARQVREGSIDGQLVRIFLRLISLVILVSLVIYAANFFGIPLTPVLAGLGVGGLAIALAVRPTLENVIGGLTLFADKPVRIGDFCRFGDDYATVEEIGLRSTRLRKLDDTVVSLPNADFSQRELTNYARRRRWLYRTTLGLRYETTAEQLRYVMAKLREMLLGHPKVSPDFLHVRFDGFGAYSLDVEIFAYIRTREWLNYRAIREDINLRVVDIVKEAGTGFAFPSQTAYLGRDAGLDAERGREAETQVQAWRSKGQLPFPEFDEGRSEEKEDVLDYPPEGSPDYKPRAGSSDPPPAPQAPPTAEPKRTGRRFGFSAKRR